MTEEYRKLLGAAGYHELALGINVIYLSRFLLKIRNLLFSTPNSKKIFIKDLTSRLKCAAFLISSKKPIDQEATVQHSPDQGGTL